MTQLVISHYARPGNRRPLWTGGAMLLGALLFAGQQAASWLAAHSAAAHGLQASLFAGLATGLGAIPVLFLRRPQEGMMAPMLGLAGGMMLAASLFSLLVPAVQIVAASTAPWPLVIVTALSLVAGAAAMQQFDRRLPDEHAEAIAGNWQQANVALIVVAIALHNLPEGLAVGVAAAAGVGHGISLGIAMQNIPEGWIVASALAALGATPWRAAAIALATGLVEPVGGLFGVIAGALAGAALPLALAAAAGSMLWVVSRELIPASHHPDRAGPGSAGLIAGFAVMSILAAIF